MVTTRQWKWASYDSHGVPSKSCAALTCMQADHLFCWSSNCYHTRARAEAYHLLLDRCNLFVLPGFALQCLCKSRFWGTQTMGSKSTNFPFQIFSASLAGTGGELCSLSLGVLWWGRAHPQYQPSLQRRSGGLPNNHHNILLLLILAIIIIIIIFLLLLLFNDSTTGKYPRLT